MNPNPLLDPILPEAIREHVRELRDSAVLAVPRTHTARGGVQRALLAVWRRLAPPRPPGDDRCSPENAHGDLKIRPFNPNPKND